LPNNEFIAESNIAYVKPALFQNNAVKTLYRKFQISTFYCVIYLSIKHTGDDYNDETFVTGCTRSSVRGGSRLIQSAGDSSRTGSTW